MAIPKPIAEVSEADLSALIAQEVREGQTIEYKRNLNTSGGARPEFLRDVSSFANATGGDIVYGLDEEDGLPTRLRAVPDVDPDRTPLQLRELCLHHIDPAIRGLQIHPVPLADGGHAMVIRIPQTWDRPHMVKFDGEDRFWRRDGAGKRRMTTAELRDAFTLSASTVDRINDFRLDRLRQIRNRESPIALEGKVYVVAHLLPLAAFEISNLLDMQEIFPRANAVLPPLAWERYGGMSKRFNFEGILSHSLSEHGACFSYVQLFRSGCLEAVDSGLLRNDPQGGILQPRFEKIVGEALPTFLEGFRLCGISPPIFVALSLLNIKGFTVPGVPGNIFSNVRGQPVPQADLILPEIQIDAFQDSYFGLLKPAFDVIWQAAGQRGDPNYDSAGNWNYLW